ncbi:MAG TPA: molecular chaperone HtpG [Burkholderiaceae bacterium]|nr:molecular chaperone HtpG [Burkholderiaceae bacterium]HQR69531.1 molecular chaperone HtpG [Burkholderiaceae bacterium]
MKQTLGFQAEVRQLLQLMIHSLYSNKEIFLRELISNASDALDKLRFESIARPALMEGHGELEIRVSYDKAARTIAVSDNGIGMSREEAIEHLGTIAKSGTREFFDRLTGDQQMDAQLIGQFGVGFYSSFIVADRVTVVTRHAGSDEAVRWESDGGGEFTVEPAQRAECGTDVTLHLREGEDDLLEGFRLKSIIGKYSDHISAPIRMLKETWDQDKGAMVITDELETVNQANALWARPKGEISDTQYQEFYRHVSHDFGEPLAWTHSRVEGRTEYTQLLYIPARAPFDLWDRNHRHGIKLYVRRVFIMDDAEQLMPPYLRFVRGVIDSNDLPLNVSREILQESRDVKAIREGSTKRVLSLLEDLAENQKDKFATFWTEFGQVLKEGMGDDPANRERIAALLRFASTAPGGETPTVSLKDYVGRMPEGQKKIYYVTADTPEAARSSPHLEIFRKKGIEVLLLTDRVDEWMLGFLQEFDGKALASVARGGLDLDTLADEQEKAEQQKSTDEFKDLVGQVKSALGERVKDVRMTLRLTDSAACLVSDEHDISGHLQRMLKAAGQKAPESRPILELNPEHALVRRLKAQDADVVEWAQVLYDQALLAEGGQLDDPAAFVRRMNRLLLDAARR